MLHASRRLHCSFNRSAFWDDKFVRDQAPLFASLCIPKQESFQSPHPLQIHRFVIIDYSWPIQNLIVAYEKFKSLHRCIPGRVRASFGTRLQQWFLADRTNGRAYATVLRLSVCRLSSSSVTLCIVAKRCVLEQKLLLRAYRKSYTRNRLVPKWMTLTFV